MPPTDYLIRLSDGTLCGAWGYRFFNGRKYYNFISHYEDASHFRYASPEEMKK